jgi:hypothetical protein
LSHTLKLEKWSRVKRNKIFFSFPHYSSISGEETPTNVEEENEDEDGNENEVEVKNEEDEYIIEETPLRRSTRISQSPIKNERLCHLQGKVSY